MLFDFESCFDSKITISKSRMTFDLIDSYLLLFTLIFNAAFIFFFDLQKSIIISIRSLSLVYIFFIEMDGFSLYFIDISFAIGDT